MPNGRKPQDQADGAGEPPCLSTVAVDAEVRARAWEAVARNLAQVLEGRDGDGILILSEQAKAHGLVAERAD